jgi:hypothetical protein
MKGDKIKYCEGYKYQVAEDYSIQTPIRPASPVNHDFISLDANGMLLIKEGYAWDGPSGPTIDTKSSMRGSLVHDALYQLMREELISEHNREVADEMLYEICIEDGMWQWRAWLWRREVRKFAGFAAMAENEAKIFTAP